MKTKLEKVFIAFLSLVIICAFSYTIWQYKIVSNELVLANQKYQTETKDAIARQKKLTDELTQKDIYILFLENENSDINKNLTDVKTKSEEDKNLIQDRIENLGKTIEQIKKIQNTDAEILEKYSKIYFLNENYIPESLSFIPTEYIVNKDNQIRLNSKVMPSLIKMIEDSKNAGSTTAPLMIISGYRSFEEQKNLKMTYKMKYGSGANTFSADQGYSEHQLGTTVDVSNEKLMYRYTSFGESQTYKWMQDNAYKYGFILSYPKGNASYIYEPWHYRFVGIELATELHNRGLYFYQMDQREIDTYLGKVFD